jgi:sugar phosphate isomerase/epimerase
MSSESSRRTFLQGVPAAMTAAAALPSAAAAAETAAGDVKLGIASYSFREFSRALAIKYTKQLNCPYLCIKEFHALYRSTPEELARARADFEKNGLPLTGGGTVYIQKEDVDDIRSYFEYAKRLGMPMMNIGPTAKTLPMIEKFAVQYDIKIAIHNHGPEDKHFPAPSDALKAVKDMDPRMGLCIDIGHTTRTGKDLLEEIALAGPRLLDMHVKDLKNLKDRDSQCDVGEGAMPIVAIFKQLKKMNYQGIVHLEYEINADNPMPGMQKSFSYMRGVNAALRG